MLRMPLPLLQVPLLCFRRRVLAATVSLGRRQHLLLAQSTLLIGMLIDATRLMIDGSILKWLGGRFMVRVPEIWGGSAAAGMGERASWRAAVRRRGPGKTLCLCGGHLGLGLRPGSGAPGGELLQTCQVLPFSGARSSLTRRGSRPRFIAGQEVVHCMRARNRVRCCSAGSYAASAAHFHRHEAW